MSNRVLRPFIQLIPIVFFYYMGIFIQESFNLIIPGSLIGMALVFLLLSIGILKVSWLEEGSNIILKWMPLFFVPVTVGIMEYKSYIFQQGWVLILIVMISTFITFIISAKIAEFIDKRRKEDK